MTLTPCEIHKHPNGVVTVIATDPNGDRYYNEYFFKPTAEMVQRDLRTPGAFEKITKANSPI